MGPRAGLDRCGKFASTGIRSPDRPARSQSLYRLSYPAHTHSEYIIIIAFPRERWLRERASKLIYTYIASFLPLPPKK